MQIVRYVVLPVLLAWSPAAGPLQAQQIRFSETAWAEFGFFMDSWAQASRSEPGAGGSTHLDAFVNLTRASVRGQLAPGLDFMVATGGERNFGSLEVWDAVLMMRASPGVTVEAGRVLLPFVRHAQQFTQELQTHDFQRTAFMYPRGSTLRRRDEGVRVRGHLLGDALDVRVAVTGGVETERGTPRLTGRIGWNAGGREAGYTLPGVYLAGPQRVSLGLAFDVQPDVLEGGGTYHAMGADAFVTAQHGANRLNGQAAVVRYRGLNGRGASGEAVVVDRAGVGAMLDAGYVIGRIGPVVAAEYFRPDGAAALSDDLLHLKAGLNAWLRGTALNAKLHAGWAKPAGTRFEDGDPVLTLQFQTRLPFPTQRPLNAAQDND